MLPRQLIAASLKACTLNHASAAAGALDRGVAGIAQLAARLSALLPLI
jgi:hypothetical protein